MFTHRTIKVIGKKTTPNPNLRQRTFESGSKADDESEWILLDKMPAQQLMSSEKGGLVNKARIVSLPFNPSSQHLMAKGSNDFSDVDLYSANIKQAASGGGKDGDNSSTAMRTHNHITRRQWITVLVLFFVNLINYMDRLTIAGRNKREHLHAGKTSGFGQIAIHTALSSMIAPTKYISERERKWHTKSFDYSSMTLI